MCTTGSEYWGLLNPEWSMCSKGRHQSPIDIDPRSLLFDPNLKNFHISQHKVITVAFVTSLCN